MNRRRRQQFGGIRTINLTKEGISMMSKKILAVIMVAMLAALLAPPLALAASVSFNLS